MAKIAITTTAATTTKLTHTLKRMKELPRNIQAFTPQFAQEHPKDLNLLQFFALLYKVDMRNKQEEEKEDKN